MIDTTQPGDAERTRPVRLAADYLRAVERVEALASNQSGADKSWVWRALEQARAHLARARRR